MCLIEEDETVVLACFREVRDGSGLAHSRREGGRVGGRDIRLLEMDGSVGI